ncbi:uncharacterized protein LOC120350719 [Nilaparvata lugens]|uniref:uncharacterized protein LOC120350719 n=1 Tax=Nilaparvata lugens TaxID=108931 RepID=UPI00193EB0FC|nr:uncharacterized protein LOC120350719 [Nilaparvata lugens]
MLSSTLILCSVIVCITATSDFCWKDSYTRGVGKVPARCAENQVGIGLFCYDNCPAGYSRFGFDCHTDCPADFRDDGLFCRHAEYGRGVGYPWKFGDPLSDRHMWARCLRDHPEGCEKHLLIVYPKCAPGYWAFGCCICRPSQPDCPALGLNRGIDLSCAKRIIIGKPQIGVCEADEELDAGLCYPKCKPGYYGVAFVCWAEAPSNWVNCGMGAAKSSGSCTSAIIGQVASVGQLAVGIATAFAASGIAKLTAPADAQRLSKLKKAYQSIKDNEEVKLALANYERLNKLKKGYVAIETALEGTTVEDEARLAAIIISITEPTGISSVVGAYTYPLCSKIVQQQHENSIVKLSKTE